VNHYAVLGQKCSPAILAGLSGPTREPTSAKGTFVDSRSAPVNATRSLSGLDTSMLCCSAHLAGHRLRLDPEGLLIGRRRRDPLVVVCGAFLLANRHRHKVIMLAGGVVMATGKCCAPMRIWFAPEFLREERRPCMLIWTLLCPRMRPVGSRYTRGPELRDRRVAGGRRFTVPAGDMNAIDGASVGLWIVALRILHVCGCYALWDSFARHG